ncbi:hypothetical protein [Nocardia lijiangensis]|uniref:hypothetical protein n=1 Tax=Nocardia lijiangensis TaxID=299618 RepID=UPI003D75A94E
MDVERKFEPESASDPEAVAQSVTAPPGDAQPSAAAASANLERDVRVATRNGRYALVTALCAAILSSGVSAGSAIYVSRSQLERNERAESAQVVRDDRRDAYAELAVTLMAYAEELGGLKGELLQNPIEREEVRAQLHELVEKGQKIWHAMTTVLLVGNRAMEPSLEKFGDEHYGPFTMNHLTTFSARHFSGSGGTDESLGRDGPALIIEIDRMVVGVGDFLASFLDQARKDLGIGSS